MALWQMFFCLALFSFVIRAFIPVGYMPDSSDDRKGTFAIAFCSVDGISTVQVDFSEDAAQEPADHQYSVDACPFGLSITHSLLPGSHTPVLAAVVSFLPWKQSASQYLPARPALGPPLGSRAPPLLSGPGLA